MGTLIQYDRCPRKKRKTPCEGGATWGEGHVTMEAGPEGCDREPRNAKDREDRRGEQGFFPDSQRDRGPGGTLLWDVWAPEL